MHSSGLSFQPLFSKKNNNDRLSFLQSRLVLSFSLSLTAFHPSHGPSQQQSPRDLCTITSRRLLHLRVVFLHRRWVDTIYLILPLFLFRPLESNRGRNNFVTRGAKNWEANLGESTPAHGAMSRRTFGEAGDDTTIQHVSRDGLRRQSPYEDIFAVLAEDTDNALEHAAARRIHARVITADVTSNASGDDNDGSRADEVAGARADAVVGRKKTKMYVHSEWGTRRKDGFSGLVGHEVYSRLAVVYEHQPNIARNSALTFSTFGFGSKAIFHYFRYLLYVVAAAPREDITDSRGLAFDRLVTVMAIPLETRQEEPLHGQLEHDFAAFWLTYGLRHGQEATKKAS